MLPSAHASAAYLLAKTPALFGYPLSFEQEMLITSCGALPDIDIFYYYFVDKDRNHHHNYITHKPVGILIMSGIVILLFKPIISPLMYLYIPLAGLLHLVVDEFGYWFTLLGWQKGATSSQIDWLYPWKHIEVEERVMKGLRKYFTKAKVNTVLEILLPLVASWIFLSSVLG